MINEKHLPVAVITGAGGVLCSVLAKALAENGYATALISLHKDHADRTADLIRASVPDAPVLPLAVNVLDKASLEEAHEVILRELGPCTVLLNGAGGNKPGATTKHEIFEKGDETAEDYLTFFNLSEDAFDGVFDLNLKGTLLPTQIFARDMIGREGCSILNISSMNAFRPLTKIPAYSAAKSAVSNFTEWLAVHFAEEGIRVNAMAPGFFVTEQNRALLFNEDGSPTARTGKILAATPMKRFGKPEELVGTLLWLVDPAKSGFVTGIVVPIDGGFSAYSGV